MPRIERHGDSRRAFSPKGIAMIRRIDREDLDELAKLVALQRAAYRVEADLIGTHVIPPLRETVVDLRASGETLWGYYADGELAGAIGFKREGDLLDIYRLAVSPAHFRCGIAGALVAHVETEARASGVRRVIVSTGAANAPAVAFYQHAGFRPTHQREVVPGLLVAHFEKSLQAVSHSEKEASR